MVSKIINKSFLVFIFWTIILVPTSLLGITSAWAATGVPSILSYQGRLMDDDSNLLGGTGTTYYFKFSFWNNSVVASGSKVWPTNNPSAVSLNVKQGVFSVNIGDTANSYPDTLDYNFSTSDEIYLQVEVSTNNVTFETLSPRQRITASAFAKMAGGLQSEYATSTNFFSSLLNATNAILGNATSTNFYTGSLGVSGTTTVNNLNFTGNFLQNGVPYVGSQWTSSSTDINFTSGKVGIGTVTPNSKLTVNNGSYGAEIARFEGSEASVYNLILKNYSPVSGVVGYSFDVRNTNTDYANTLTILPAKVGVNIANPGTTLDVNGGLWINSPDVDANATMQFRNNLGGTFRGFVGYVSTPNAVLLTTDGSAATGFFSYAAGGQSLIAGGTNQNITLTPSGTGYTQVNAGEFLVSSGSDWSALPGGGYGVYSGFANSHGYISAVSPGVAGAEMDILGNPIVFLSSQSGAELVRIDADGKVGIGTSTPSNLLTMGIGGGYYNEATGAWAAGSDRAYKDNIVDLSKYGLSTVNALRPVSYIVKHSGIEQVGFIAQEVKEIVPELVSGEDGMMGLNYGGFTPILVKAVQELNSQVQKIGSYVVDGVANFASIIATKFTGDEADIKNIKTEKICIGETCIDEQTLKDLLEEKSVGEVI